MRCLSCKCTTTWSQQTLRTSEAMLLQANNPQPDRHSALIWIPCREIWKDKLLAPMYARLRVLTHNFHLHSCCQIVDLQEQVKYWRFYNQLTVCSLTAILTLLEPTSGCEVILFSYLKTKYLQYTTTWSSSLKVLVNTAL